MHVFVLEKEDYEEPRCPFCVPNPPKADPIPLRRVLFKLDEYFSRGDTDGALAHLTYWLAEAETAADERGTLAVLNELVGLSRKRGEEDPAIAYGQRALRLSETIFSDTVTHATTLINVATAYKAFDRAEDAMPLYDTALALYEKHLPKTDDRWGGLYNNRGLALMDLHRFREAEESFMAALGIMKQVADGEPEQAITWCNLADLAVAAMGEEAAEARVTECLNTARNLLNTEGLRRDGNYAYVCEKCATVFGYYGYFADEKTFGDRAREIYERT